MSSPAIDFAAVRAAVPLREFLQSLGITLRQDGQCWRGKCPLHNEKHGASLVLYNDERWYCHGKCAAQFPKGGDVVDLAGALWSSPDRLGVVERLLGKVPTIDVGARPHSIQSSSPPKPKWPACELEKIDEIIRAGFRLYDLWDQSPIRFGDGVSHSEEIIDTIFPGNPLLCIGKTAWSFATDWREAWRGRLSEYALIVGNPMLRKERLTASGSTSPPASW
jgi:hypothetical protein